MNVLPLSYGVEGLTRQCPICGSAEITTIEPSLEKKMPFDGKKVCFIDGCRRCGVIFTNPQRPQDNVDQYYAEDGGWVEDKMYRIDRGKDRQHRMERYRQGGQDPAGSKLITKLDDFLRHPEIRQFFDPLQAVKGRDRVLDFGCGIGYTLDIFKAFGWQTYGLDPATANLIEIHEVVRDLPRQETFDVVVSHHVLEHLSDPLDQLRAIHRATKLGGYLLVGIPFLDHIGSNGDRDYCINYHVHSIAFTSTALKTLLAMVGFEVLVCFTRKNTARIGCLAVKRADAIAADSDPLKPAVEALRDYRRTHGSKEAAWAAALPIPMRAEFLNRRHQQKRLRRRDSKRAAAVAEKERRVKRAQDEKTAQRQQREADRQARLRERQSQKSRKKLTRRRAKAARFVRTVWARLARFSSS